MTLVAITGDATTTTTVALAAAWPSDDVLVLEVDPSGGSLAGWLDTPASPSLATVIANIRPDTSHDNRNDHRHVLATIETMAQRSRAGIRFVPNAVRARAAHRAVEEFAGAVLPAISGAPLVVIADSGRHQVGHVASPVLASADVIVIVHRQPSASAAAATVRIERLVESVEELAHLDVPVVLAVIGRTPFDPNEIASFVDDSVPGALGRAVPGTARPTIVLADDPLAAATLAGRAGVSAGRLGRLPLTRDAARAALMLRDLLAERRDPVHALGSGGVAGFGGTDART